MYEIGEGQGGVQIDATNLATGQTTSTQTWSTGGYQIALSPGQYQITASVNGTVFQTLPVTIGTQNVEQDFVLSNTWDGRSRDQVINSLVPSATTSQTSVPSATTSQPRVTSATTSQPDASQVQTCHKPACHKLRHNSDRVPFRRVTTRRHRFDPGREPAANFLGLLDLLAGPGRLSRIGDFPSTGDHEGLLPKAGS